MYLYILAEPNVWQTNHLNSYSVVWFLKEASAAGTKKYTALLNSMERYVGSRSCTNIIE